jgi:putative hydrolase of the HAD superfamily
MEIDAIGFDADDTLWHNEDHFAATEDAFAELMAPWASDAEARSALLAVETQNLELFGYGVKAFMLSMVETAMELSRGAIEVSDLGVLLDRGKAMLERPTELLHGVSDVLTQLADTYRLILITKGELHHQERKIESSGIANLFSAVEVVSEKDTSTYHRIIRRHTIDPTRFVMIGNSVKSDILPVLELGGFGIHIPYTFTWAHEQVAKRDHNTDRLWEVASVREVPPLLATLI